MSWQEENGKPHGLSSNSNWWEKGAHDWHWIQAFSSPGKESTAEPKVKSGLEQNFSTTVPHPTWCPWGASTGLEAQRSTSRLTEPLPKLSTPPSSPPSKSYLFGQMPCVPLMGATEWRGQGSPRSQVRRGRGWGEWGPCLGTKCKKAPKNLVIKVKNISMQCLENKN